MKVLLSAYQCRPDQGSESSVAWNMVLEMAKHHAVWLITREDNRPCIEAQTARNSVHAKFVYYDLPPWIRWLRARQWAKPMYYYLWQVGAYFVVKRHHRRLGFDLTHHVTFVRYWSPSFIALLPIPFIWGPVGGGESAPKVFRSTFGIQGRIYEAMRDFARQVSELDYFVRLTARRSAIALATTKDTAARLRALTPKKIDVVGQCGLSKQEIEHLGSLPSAPVSPIRFVSIGRLLHWKGFHLGLEAFARTKLETAQYWIVGDGPERHRLERLAHELRISDRVRFWEKLPRIETWRILAQCHALVHPSLHDSGGFVCLEAMGAGRPVLCLDLGGPATQVTEETGIKIAARHPEQVLNDLARAMTRVAQDTGLRAGMGREGKKRIAEVYDWDMKGRFFAHLYEDIAGTKDYSQSSKVYARSKCP